MTPLRKTYQSTVDEATESAIRFLELTGTIRRQFLRTLIGLALFSSIPTIFFPYNAVERLKLGLTVFTFLALTIGISFKRGIRNNIRRTQILARGTDQPYDSEYELNEIGITFKLAGSSHTFFWSHIHDLQETQDSIEVYTTPTGVIRIPKRILSDSEIHEWISFINDNKHQQHHPAA